MEPDLRPFVTAGWLAGHRDEVVVADVRWYLDDRDGRAAHRAGHVPGAVFVDLDEALAGEPGERGRHPLPDPVDFAEAMGRAGIGDDDVVVGYDDAGGAIAARLVWMLRVTGHMAAVLDGGIQAWRGAFEEGSVERPAAAFTPRPWPPDRVADADEVARLAGRGEALVVDARDRERYRGEREPVDPRAGHIPGAVSLPYRDNLEGERLVAPEDLERRFRAAGVPAAREVVVYCGSGVTACHDVLAMESVGITARLYPGSWSQWSRDPRRPAARGPDPGDRDPESSSADADPG